MVSVRDNHFHHVTLAFVALAKRHNSRIQHWVLLDDFVRGPCSSLSWSGRDQEGSPLAFT